MNKSTFIVLFISMNVLFVFVKIYQHHATIALLYRKQRIENASDTLKKEYQTLSTTLMRSTHYEMIKAHALAAGMVPLKFAHLKPFHSLYETLPSSQETVKSTPLFTTYPPDADAQKNVFSCYNTLNTPVSPW